MFQIESFHLKSNHQNGSNRDLNPNRDWDLPITDTCHFECSMAEVCTLLGTIWFRGVTDVTFLYGRMPCPPCRRRGNHLLDVILSASRNLLLRE